MPYGRASRFTKNPLWELKMCALNARKYMQQRVMFSWLEVGIANSLVRSTV